jgi:hypothetical protein
VRAAGTAGSHVRATVGVLVRVGLLCAAQLVSDHVCVLCEPMCVGCERRV